MRSIRPVAAFMRAGAVRAFGRRSDVGVTDQVTTTRLEQTILQGAFGLTAEANSKAVPRARAGQAGGKRAARSGGTHVSSALRTAYEKDVQEDVPQEFLDLLGKLA